MASAPTPAPATPPPPDAPQWRILAVDYGTRRTGLAVTDPGRLIATGLAGVDTARLLPFLDDYTRREPVGLFVVGYPLDLDGRPTHATPAVDLFLRQLANRWPTVPRYRADERFTSAEAARSLAASGLRRKARRDKHLLDEVAATLILQAYLDAHGGHRPPGATPPSPAP